MEEIDTWYRDKQAEREYGLLGTRRSSPNFFSRTVLPEVEVIAIKPTKKRRHTETDTECNSNKNSPGNHSFHVPVGNILHVINRPNMKKSADGGVSNNKHFALYSKKKSPLTSKQSGGSGKSSIDEEKTASAEDVTMIESLTVPHPAANGGSVDNIDCVDGTQLPADPQRTKEAIKHLQQKISRTKDAIKEAQNAKEENVNEYLRLASSADKQQLQRIKTVFEKKNQKSAQTIAQLQKKLEGYQKKLRDVELFGVSGHRPPKEVLRDMGHGLKGVGANIRDGITGLSGGMVGNIKGATEMFVSKPREIAHLVKNKFGSADNIATIKVTDDEVRSENNQPIRTLPANFRVYCSDEEASSDISGSGVHSSPKQQISNSPSQNQLDEMPISNTVAVPLEHFQEVELKLSESLENQMKFTEVIENLRLQIAHLTDEIQANKQTLDEVKFHITRIEEQQNDWTELHQTELANVKQEIASMEEKVEYQLEERTSDMHDLLENCQTRITKMELHQQQQQLISVEGVENATARVLITKLINVVLAILAVILVFVSTITNVVSPFLTTRLRIIVLIMLIMVFIVVVQHVEIYNNLSLLFKEKYNSIRQFFDK